MHVTPYQLRTEIVGAIKSSKVPKSNISKAEKRPSVTETGGFHHEYYQQTREEPK